LPAVAASLGQYYTTTAAGGAALAAVYAQAGGDPTDAAALGAWTPGYIQDQAASTIADWDVAFGYDLTFEFEPSVGSIPLDKSGKLLFGAGLPFNFKYGPGNEIKDLVDAEDKYSFGINPYASLFFTSLAVPFQLQLGYNIPVAGKNTAARHVVVLQAKVFLKFWGE
jgi:hypothetical protein